MTTFVVLISRIKQVIIWVGSGRDNKFPVKGKGKAKGKGRER